jgi:hypothetical protein
MSKITNYIKPYYCQYIKTPVKYINNIIIIRHRAENNGLLSKIFLRFNGIDAHKTSLELS